MALTAELPWLQAPWQRLTEALRQDRFAHGLLLSGAPGLGKKRFAQALAARLLCARAKGDEPACGQCKSCQLLAAGSHPDLSVLAPEEGKKQIAVGSVRELRERLVQSAHQGQYRVAIVEPAEAMNVNAANALLKTLEEPGPATVLLLVSSRPQAIAVTVRSRCQQVPFHAPPAAEALTYLQQQGADPQLAQEALQLCAGAPLAAQALLNSGELERGRVIERLMEELKTGSRLPISGAETLQKENPLLICSAMARYLARQLREAGPEQAPLFRIMDRITEARKLLLNNANVNATLLLESLLLAWFELHAKLRHSR